MPPSPLPLIAERDYPAFQRIIPELLHTSYGEWIDDHEKSVAYRRSRNGFSEIPVSASDFEGWLKANAKPAHLELLWVFAEETATGIQGSNRQSNDM
jgi:hypothetical protein